MKSGYYLVSLLVPSHVTCIAIHYFKKKGRMYETWVNTTASVGSSQYGVQDPAEEGWLESCVEEGDTVQKISKHQFEALYSLWDQG